MNLQQKREEEEELQQSIFLARLKKERKEQQAAKKLKKRKMVYTDMPNLSIFEELSLFDLEFNKKSDFKAKSHNKDKQIQEFFSFVYFKFEAPLFLINILIEKAKAKENHLKKYTSYKLTLLDERTPFDNVSLFELYQVIATGGSVRKLLSEFLNKKEVHYFLNSTRDDLKVALLESKMTYLNFNSKDIDFLLSKYRIMNSGISQKNIFILTFFSKNMENLDRNKIEECIDYFFIGLDDNIDLKNYFSRSFNNIIIDVDDWHIAQIFVKTIKKTRWEQSYSDWEYIKNTIDTFYIKELHTATMLSEEGREMGHCVGSYARSCASGRSIIFSLSRFRKRMVTFELTKNNLSIVQIKGKHNRNPTAEEVNIINRFARDKGFSLSRYI